MKRSGASASLHGILSAICVLLPLATTATATTYLVRPDGTGDFVTIQDAINDPGVVDGDIIELANGTFTGDGNRNMDYQGKAITIRSESGDPDLCIIDCEGETRGFHFQSGETLGSQLVDVTVTNGQAQYGAAICITSPSSPTIIGCKLVGNHADNSPAIHCWGQSCSPTIIGCTISGNTATSGNSGMGSQHASPTVINCIFADNHSDVGGGALWCHGGTPSVHTFVDCIFAGNTAAVAGGAVICNQGAEPTFTNCTFFGNGAPEGGTFYLYDEPAPMHVDLEGTIIACTTQGGTIYCGGESTATLICCDVWGNVGGDYVDCIAGQNGVNGNFSADPLFCDAESGDFTLAENSPCASHNTPEGCCRIGARGVGCGFVAVESLSWGRIKALYR